MSLYFAFDFRPGLITPLLSPSVHAYLPLPNCLFLVLPHTDVHIIHLSGTGLLRNAINEFIGLDIYTSHNVSSIDTNTVKHNEIDKSRKRSLLHNVELPVIADTEPHLNISQDARISSAHLHSCTHPWKHIYRNIHTCILYFLISTLSTPSVISISHSAGKDGLCLL